jgi:hypothetical protein
MTKFEIKNRLRNRTCDNCQNKYGNKEECSKRPHHLPAARTCPSWNKSWSTYEISDTIRLKADIDYAIKSLQEWRQTHRISN